MTSAVVAEEATFALAFAKKIGEELWWPMEGVVVALFSSLAGLCPLLMPICECCYVR